MDLLEEDELIAPAPVQVQSVIAQPVVVPPPAQVLLDDDEVIAPPTLHVVLPTSPKEADQKINTLLDKDKLVVETTETTLTVRRVSPQRPVPSPIQTEFPAKVTTKDTPAPAKVHKDVHTPDKAQTDTQSPGKVLKEANTPVMTSVLSAGLVSSAGEPTKALRRVSVDRFSNLQRSFSFTDTAVAQDNKADAPIYSASTNNVAQTVRGPENAAIAAMTRPRSTKRSSGTPIPSGSVTMRVIPSILSSSPPQTSSAPVSPGRNVRREQQPPPPNKSKISTFFGKMSLSKERMGKLVEQAKEAKGYAWVGVMK